MEAFYKFVALLENIILSQSYYLALYLSLVINLHFYLGRHLILARSDTGRCQRQMISLETTVKLSIQIAQEKTMVNHSCILTKKTTETENTKCFTI